MKKALFQSKCEMDQTNKLEGEKKTWRKLD